MNKLAINVRSMLTAAAVIALAIIPLATSGCAGTSATTSQPTATVKNVNVADSYKLIQDNLNNDNFIIIDVRTPEEYAAGHIADSILIDFYEASFKEEINKLDKNQTYFVYCRSGNRSGSAAKLMVENGFKDVYNMTGGFTDWQKTGYPTTK